MNTNVSRRSLAKGAAWSTPLVLATSVVPSYAASQENSIQYGVVDSSSSTYSTRWDYDGCTGVVETSTDALNPGQAPISYGFAVIYNPESVTAANQSMLAKTAVYNKVEYVVTFPKGMVSAFTIDPSYASYWSYRKENRAMIEYEDGGEKKVADGSNLDVFVFSFEGYNSGLVNNPEGYISPSRQSKMRATAVVSGMDFCGPDAQRAFVQYAGYVYDVTLNTGERIQTDTITWRNISNDQTAPLG